jgi:hypothetical protein
MIDNWIDSLRAAGLTAREMLVALWLRASIRVVASRLAEQSVLPNRFATWHFEKLMMEGATVDQVRSRNIMYANATLSWNW